MVGEQKFIEKSVPQETAAAAQGEESGAQVALWAEKISLLKGSQADCFKEGSWEWITAPWWRQMAQATRIAAKWKQIIKTATKSRKIDNMNNITIIISFVCSIDT